MGVGRAATPSPNVLVIIADDQGYGDFGFMGNHVVKTPNIDRLASQSAVFKNFVVAPACSPTRSSFLTGRNHLSVGVWGVGSRGYTLRDETIMPKFFQSAGYGTGYFGKRDSTYVLEVTPWERGCDDAFTISGGYVHHDPTIAHKSGSDDMKGWTCDINVDQALGWIREQGDKSWWATVAFIVPHLPWICDEKFSAPYLKEGCSQKLAEFYGCVTQMDAAVGRLLEGIPEGTIVVFFSDNGPSYKESSEEDVASRNVAKLRGSKATAWENGIREPLLVRWPGKIPPGERPQFATVEDLLPMLIDLAGLPAPSLPPHLPFDGISIRPALEDPAAPDPERSVLRIAISGDGSPQDHARTGVIADPRDMRFEDHHVTLRSNRFKFHFLPGGETALYDIAADPGETSDASALHPEIAAAMAKAGRVRWEEILASGRAFRMPAIVVTKTPSPGTNKIDAAMAQRVQGQVRGLFEGVRGFTATGDSAEYAIDVRDAGKYKILVAGSGGLERCAGLTLTVGGTRLDGRKKSADSLEFGPVELAGGPGKLTLSLEGVSPDDKKPVLITHIGFFPTPGPAKEKP